MKVSPYVAEEPSVKEMDKPDPLQRRGSVKGGATLERKGSVKVAEPSRKGSVKKGSPSKAGQSQGEPGLSDSQQSDEQNNNNNSNNR